MRLWPPSSITTDQLDYYLWAIERLQREGKLSGCKHGNNIIEAKPARARWAGDMVSSSHWKFMDPSSGEITRLLTELEARKTDAVPRLFELLYRDLRRIAQHHFANERAEHSLQATALVHEAYMRLVGASGHWQNRAHFLGVASGVMRRILVDHARAKRASKRPDSRQRVVLEEALFVSSNEFDNVIDIDQALSRLASIDARQSRIVELRYFGGLTAEEAAEVLDVSLNTVKRDWSVAKAWLYRELQAKSTAK